MAVDQNSVLNRTALPFPTPPPPWAPVLPHHPPTTTAEQPDEQPSPKKVKLLCSFGGRILPRPGDGALRYVGGHTRIISVPNDVSFPDLMLKMADACGSGGPVVLKYQLPDEDLDALISVSCPEDLENMMEEYDKVTAASLDGSAKLRTFLFSPSSDSTGPPPSVHLDDTGQSYIDALNWVADDRSPRSMQRKESVESTASYTQNTDGIIGGSETADGSNEGTSPPLLSPTVDASSLVYLGANVPAVGSIVPSQTQNPAWMEPPPAAPYAQQAYIGPHQVQYINPQPLGMAGGHPTINLVPFTPHPYQPAAQIITNSLVAHASGLMPIQPRVDPFMGENQYGGRVVQPLSQLPPLPPAYLQPQNVEQFSLNQMPPQGQMLRFDDCLMCQKALPHVHSDTLLQGHGNETPGGILEVSPPFYGHHSEDTRKVRAPQMVTGALADNAVEPKVTSTAAASQLGVHGFPQTVQYADERSIQQKIDNLDRVGVLLPPESLGLSGDAQPPHGMLLNDLPQSRHEDPLQQQPQRRNLGPPLYQVKQEVITKPLGIDASFVRNERLQQPSQSLMGDTVHESSNNYARPIDAMMEGLRVSPTDNSLFNEQWKAVAKPKLGSSSSSPLDVENDYYFRTQAGGYEMFSDRVIANSGIVPKGNFVKPINQLPPTSSDVAHTQNLQPAGAIQVSNMIGNHGPNASNLGLEVEPPAPNGWLLGMPVHPCSIDPGYNDRTINKIPAGNWNEGTEDVLNHIPATQRGNILFPSSTASSPYGHVEPSQEPVTSDSSLFCNEDPCKVLGVAQLLPLKPGRMANEEPVISKDSFIGKHLGNMNDSNIVTLLEEGSFYPLPDPLNRDLHPEPVRPGKGSTEEHIKQELQAVAEDVAAAVLHSSVPPVPVFIKHETKEHNIEFDKERGIIDDNAEPLGKAMVDLTIEDTKPRCLDKMNPGLQITEGIGRLQIIKNSDLEELRELGSGTFGTVYHGKWRGSDVAIKRINDRCFAGKPSEQERMRSDFWNEACKLADLHHPNVVAFYGVVLDGPGGSVATVTEYMVNGSLRNALQSNERTFDRRKRLLIATDVAFGMEYLHGKNIVHFDLKSDNLLVNLRDPQRPICKVGDLGLSKVKCQTLISGGVRGTLPWMAPELLNGSSSLVSEKVDVFSFGIVMWELLTGQEPYADLHYGAIIGGIVSNTLRPLVPEACDPEWRLLMENCWSAEPSERPSFTEIASRLRSVAASLPQKGHNQRLQPSVV